MKATRRTDFDDGTLESLGTARSRDSLCQEVAEAAQLLEGAAGVEAFLRAVAREQPRSLKALARRLSWPLPVAAAVRRELEKRKILDRREGLSLSEQGRILCKAGLPALETAQPCSHCGGAGWQISEALSAALLPELEALCRARPEVDVTLDQALATPETNLRRALYVLSALSLPGRRIVFLGDDDWTSASLLLTYRKLNPQEALDFSVEVFDIDPRIIEGLNAWARKEQLPLQARESDLRRDSALPALEDVEAVFTDPPYTEAGLELFCRRARQLLPEARGEFFLCYPIRDPQRRYQMEAIWHRQGFALLEFYRGWNGYEGNSLHAGQSALWHLQAVRPGPKEPLGCPSPSIYTFDAKKEQIRRYRCRRCGHIHQVGPQRPWSTVEALKKAGCPSCGARTFARC